jgi:hypothetical protein
MMHHPKTFFAVRAFLKINKGIIKRMSYLGAKDGMAWVSLGGRISWQ